MNAKKLMFGLLFGCMILCSACGSTESDDYEETNNMEQDDDDVIYDDDDSDSDEMEKDEDDDAKKENDENENNEDNSLEVSDYSVYTKDYPVEKRTLDYYWNIDTSGFDKNMFDGTFSVFGYDLNGKITGSSLQTNGFGIETDNYPISLLWDSEENCYSDLTNGTEIYMGDTELGYVALRNYNNEDSFYSDYTEVDFFAVNIDTTFSEAIIPKCLVTNKDDKILETITFDDVIEHLGVPTYVIGRQDHSIDDVGLIEYLYAYDDYILIFSSVFLDRNEAIFSDVAYTGMSIYNQPCTYYDADTGESENFDSPFGFLERDQALYLESIK